MKEIGHLLNETRNNLGYDIDKAAKELKVRACYIKALEDGDVSDVSKDIYIIGYLKSYANWLGLNSNEIVSKFKSANEEFSVANKISTETSSFFGFEEELLNPGKPLALFCLVILVVSYVAWSQTANIQSATKLAFLNDSWQGDSKYKGFSFKANSHKPMILVAQEQLLLKLFYSDQQIIEKQLASGDMHFLSDDNDVLISADKPQLVDIFSNDDNGQYLGTLEELYVFN